MPNFAPRFFESTLGDISTLGLPLNGKRAIRRLYRRIFPIVFSSRVVPGHIGRTSKRSLILASTTGCCRKMARGRTRSFCRGLGGPSSVVPMVFNVGDHLMGRSKGMRRGI